MKRPMRSYSLKPGDSIYPIENGYVIRLEKPYKCMNPKIGAITDHTVYLWIMKCHKVLRNQAPKDRKITVTRLLIPTITDIKKKYIISRRVIQRETICSLMRKYGYTIHAKKVMNNYKKDYDYKNFYISVGLIKIGLDLKPYTTL